MLCIGGITHRSAQPSASERAVPPLRVACCMSSVSCAVPALPIERIRARCLLVRHRRLLPDQPVVVRTRDVPVGRARSTHVREERRVVVPAVRPAVTDRPCRAVPRRRTPCHPLWSHRVALVHRDASCATAPLAQARMLGKARQGRARQALSTEPHSQPGLAALRGGRTGSAG